MEAPSNEKQMMEHLQPSAMVILLRLVAAIFLLDTLYALFVLGFFALNNFHEWHDAYIGVLLVAHSLKFLLITTIIIKLFTMWASRAYYLSGHHLIERTGIVNLTETTHELSQVKSVVVKQSWLGRRFHFGTIILTLAGASKPEEIVLRDINDAMEYKKYFDKYLQVQGWVR